MPRSGLRSRLAAATPPVYPDGSSDALRPLDPTEHNMERHNAMARGAGASYHMMRIRGDLTIDDLRRGLNVMADRHPMLRVRIGKDPKTGTLVFVPTEGDRPDGTAEVPVVSIEVDALEDWVDLVQRDMNLGSIASGRGPLFAFALLEPRDAKQKANAERMLVELHHHSAADGLSSLALVHELLEEVSSPRTWEPRPDRPLASQYSLPPRLEGQTEEFGSRVRALAQGGEITESMLEARDELLAALEDIEGQLLEGMDEAGRYSQTLLTVHALLGQLGGMRPNRVFVRRDQDVGTGLERYDTVGTGLLHRSIEPSTFEAMRVEAKKRGRTIHSVLTAAVLFARGERHWAEAPREPGVFPLITPVSLRGQFTPPLEPFDVRMAVDVAVTYADLRPDDRFWDVAARMGHDVRRDVKRRRVLSSWFRTPRRDLRTGPTGAPLVIVSNLGRPAMNERYGDLELLEVTGAIAGHGGPHMGLVASTFRGCLQYNFQFETPTISRASAERFADSIAATLREIAAGREPQLGSP